MTGLLIFLLAMGHGREDPAAVMVLFAGYNVMMSRYYKLAGIEV